MKFIRIKEPDNITLKGKPYRLFMFIAIIFTLSFLSMVFRKDVPYKTAYLITNAVFIILPFLLYLYSKKRFYQNREAFPEVESSYKVSYKCLNCGNVIYKTLKKGTPSEDKLTDVCETCGNTSYNKCI